MDGFYKDMMSKTKTTRYDVADHHRTHREMAAYLEACLDEADGDGPGRRLTSSITGRSQNCHA